MPSGPRRPPTWRRPTTTVPLPSKVVMAAKQPDFRRRGRERGASRRPSLLHFAVLRTYVNLTSQVGALPVSGATRLRRTRAPFHMALVLQLGPQQRTESSGLTVPGSRRPCESPAHALRPRETQLAGERRGEVERAARNVRPLVDDLRENDGLPVGDEDLRAARQSGVGDTELALADDLPAPAALAGCR